jgi:hypothetical protein
MDGTEAVLQRVLSARNLEGLEERGDSDACPIGVDESHPLW